MSRTLLGSFAVWLFCTPFLGLGLAQAPIPLPGGAPLVYVRILGPQGMQVGFYQGTPVARVYEAPVAVGMRPGYLHRVQLSNIAGHPGLLLFPTFEVRGTLYLPAKLRASSYPAAVVFSPEEIDRVTRGSLLTKVIYLEDPEKAVPVASSPDRPFEMDVRPGVDPFAEAKAHGRPMIVVRLGTRMLEPDDMARQTQPGLILLPQESVLQRPPVAPYLSFGCWPLYDPLAGPRLPDEECLKDGGDRGLAAGFDRQGNLHGLDPSDTVAEYRNSAGKKQLAISNRVCICVPRYGVLRAETPLAGYETMVSLGANHVVQTQLHVAVKTPSLEAEQAMPPKTLRLRERPSLELATLGPYQIVFLELLRARTQITEPMQAFLATGLQQRTFEQSALMRKQVEVAYEYSEHRGPKEAVGVVGPAVVGRIEGTRTIKTLQEARDFTACCAEKIEVPDKPLQLCKWAEQHEVHIGDIVTFHLRYANVGGKPITDIAVSDSLTARLEYIPGSARSDRDAVFTMQENEAGSLVIRWEITGVLQPAQTGVVTFQARIR